MGPRCTKRSATFVQRGETGWILGVRTVTLVGRWRAEKKSERDVILLVLSPDSLFFSYVVLGVTRGAGDDAM